MFFILLQGDSDWALPQIAAGAGPGKDGMSMPSINKAPCRQLRPVRCRRVPGHMKATNTSRNTATFDRASDRT